MGLSDLCIRRPVFATVLSLVVVLLGLVSYTRLQVREYPRIDEPVVTVSARYAGASAEIIESQVTKPMEDSIAGIEGVDILTSISRPEQSQITVRFRLDRDPDGAAAAERAQLIERTEQNHEDDPDRHGEETLRLEEHGAQVRRPVTACNDEGGDDRVDGEDDQGDGDHEVDQQQAGSLSCLFLVIKEIHRWKPHSKDTLGASRSCSEETSNSWASPKPRMPAKMTVGKVSRAVL